MKISKLQKLRSKGKRKFCFEYNKLYTELECESTEERDKWVDSLNKIIKDEQNEIVKTEELIILLDNQETLGIFQDHESDWMTPIPKREKNKKSAILV